MASADAGATHGAAHHVGNGFGVHASGELALAPALENPAGGLGLPLSSLASVARLTAAQAAAPLPWPSGLGSFFMRYT